MYSWANKQLKKYDLVDIKLIQIAAFVFALLVAKFWSQILSLDWYWYVLVIVIALIRPMMKLFK